MNKLKIVKRKLKEDKSSRGIFVSDIFLNGRKMSGIRKFNIGTKVGNLGRMEVTLVFTADIETVNG